MDIPGVPPHALHSKVNYMVILTRNLNFKQGLVYGQKAIVRSFISRVMHVETLDEQNSLVLIPRIRFKAKAGRNGTTFSKLQLPSSSRMLCCHHQNNQSQTLSKIGLDWRDDVFTHGQLCVALSRAQKRSSIMCLKPPLRLRGNNHTTALSLSPTISSLQQTLTFRFHS